MCAAEKGGLVIAKEVIVSVIPSKLKIYGICVITAGLIIAFIPTHVSQPADFNPMPESYGDSASSGAEDEDFWALRQRSRGMHALLIRSITWPLAT